MVFFHELGDGSEVHGEPVALVEFIDPTNVVVAERAVRLDAVHLAEEIGKTPGRDDFDETERGISRIPERVEDMAALDDTLARAEGASFALLPDGELTFDDEGELILVFVAVWRRGKAFWGKRVEHDGDAGGVFLGGDQEIRAEFSAGADFDRVFWLCLGLCLSVCLHGYLGVDAGRLLSRGPLDGARNRGGSGQE
jgi:hypothetical protein